MDMYELVEQYDAADRAKLPDWRDSTRVLTRTMTYENAQSKLHRNIEKLDEKTWMQIMSHIPAEARRNFERTSTINYNLMNMYTGRFIYNTGGECFLACSLYDYKQQTFSLYRPGGLKFAVVIIDGNLKRLDDNECHREISAAQTRSAFLLAVQARPSCVEFKRLYAVTVDHILTVCEQMPGLLSVYISECPNAPPGSIFSKDSLDRLNRVLRFEETSGLLVWLQDAGESEQILVDEIVDGIPAEQKFVRAEAVKRDDLVDISYDMTYLTDFYENDSGHTRAAIKFDLGAGLALEFIGIIKAMHDCGYNVFQKPKILSMILDMESFLWRGWTAERREDQCLLRFLRNTLDNWPDCNAGVKEYHISTGEYFWPPSDNMMDDQRQDLGEFWDIVRIYFTTAASGPQSKKIHGQYFRTPTYCQEHGYGFPDIVGYKNRQRHGGRLIGVHTCYRCRNNKVRAAFTMAVYPEDPELPSAFRALDCVTFEDQRTFEDQPSQAELNRARVLRSPDGSLQVLNFTKHARPNFTDPKKQFSRPALASETGKARMSRDLQDALATMRMGYRIPPEQLAERSQRPDESLKLSVGLSLELLQRVVLPDGNLTINHETRFDFVCPLSINSECYTHCDMLKLCSKADCEDPQHIKFRYGNVNKPCPRNTLGLGDYCDPRCCWGNHRGVLKDASSAERCIEHKKEYEPADAELWLEARSEERRKLKCKFRYLLHETGVRRGRPRKPTPHQLASQRYKGEAMIEYEYWPPRDIWKWEADSNRSCGTEKLTDTEAAKFNALASKPSLLFADLLSWASLPALYSWVRKRLL